MALAMKTACCGKSLRTVTLILLYFHLVINAWILFSTFTHLGNSSYSRVYGGNSAGFFLDTIFMIIGCLIFLFAILTIYKEKPSPALLTAAIVFLMVNVIYAIFMIIVLNSSDNVRDMYFMLVENQAKNLEESKRNEYMHLTKSSYRTIMFFINVVLVAGIAFKLYSALVFYSYKEDLKSKPGYIVPPQNMNEPGPPSGPYPANPQFASPIYPSQFTQQYPVLPAQYPTQPPQYPTQPAQYPTQPSQYPYPPTQPYPQAPPQYEGGFK